jgi:hypothetical protein
MVIWVSLPAGKGRDQEDDVFFVPALIVQATYRTGAVTTFFWSVT